MPLVKSVQIDIGVKGDTASKAKLDSISARAEELKKAFPEYTLKIDSAAATERLKVFRDQLRAIPNETTTKVKVKVDSSALDKLSKSGFLQPSGLGIAAALSPALIPLAGSIAGAVGAIGISFGAAALGAGLFGLAAKSVLTEAAANVKKLATLNLAVAKATTAAQKKSALAALDAFKSTFAPGYLAFLGQLETFQGRWRKISQTIAIPALTAWLGALVKGLPLLRTAVKPVADVFQLWGQILKDNFSNPAVMRNLQGMAAAFGKFSASQLTLVGGAIADIALGVFHLGKDLAGSGANFSSFGIWLNNIGSGFLTWSKSGKARADVQGFLHYLHQEGPVVKSLLQSLGTILPGIFAGASQTGTLELQAISGFLGLIAKLPKGWQQPLTEAAGAILLLSKTGVLSTGLKLTFPKADAGKGALAASLGMRLISGAFIVPATVMILGTIIPKDTSKQAAADFKNQPGIIVKVSDFLHTQGLGAWVDQYFSHPIRRWALTTLPDTLDTAASKVGVFLTKTIPTDALRMAFSITGTFGKLPGPLGAPFRKAHAVIAGELAAIQFKAAQTARQINADWGTLHGKKVALTFGLNLPPGVSFPSRPIKGRGATGIKGAAAGTWLVGEQGPELAWLPQGTHVLPAGPTRKIMGGLAGGTVGDFRGIFPSSGTIGSAASAMQAAVSSIASAVRGLLHINKSAFSFSGGFAGPGGGAPSANAALAHRLYASQLSAASWAAWNYVAMRESGWSNIARNQSSGAYGIAQALPPTKYPFAGQAAGGSNPTAQISWMWNYMAGRYGGPIGAANHERAFNWYGNGLDAVFSKRTLIGVGERGPEHVMVTPRGRAATPIVLQVRAPHGATNLERALVEIIQKFVTVQGGDVQSALGRT